MTDHEHVYRCQDCGLMEHEATDPKYQEGLESERLAVRKLAQSNSKSEDTIKDYMGNVIGATEPPQDTSLDDIFDNHGQVVGYGDYYQTETLADIKIEIMAWHKAERAKLFEQIRSEVIGEDEEMHRLNPSMNTRILQMVRESNYLADNQNKLRAEQREALTRLEQE